MKQSIHLNKKFNVNLIDKIKFHDPMTAQEETCECWDFDCGRCGHFNFDISDNEIRFFYGDYPILGFYDNAKNKLRILFHQCPIPKDFVQTGVFKFEQKHPVPKLMSNFLTSLNYFADSANDAYIDLAIDFDFEFMSKYPDYGTSTPLPF